MKKIIPTLLVLAFFQASIAQQTQPLFINNPFPKTITVSGSAEMEIIPDEIYVNIELKEYQKKGDPKKDLETIKKQFLDYCKSSGIPDSAISIESYSGNGNYYSSRKKKKTADLFAGITYQIKFNSSKTMDNLVEKLDDDATQSFVIALVSHSRIIEFRRYLKIKAVQAAKEKGTYLTEAVGEKLGEAITITEPTEWNPEIYSSLRSHIIENQTYSSNYLMPTKPESSEVDFKRLKLRFEVNVVFALK